jgi:feruloyl esterase
MTRENHPSRWIGVASLIACSTLLAACGGGGWGGKAANLAVPDKASLAQACVGMAGKTVSSGQIGLASGRATVSSATLVPAVTTAPAFAEYCRLQGSIAPLTAGADPIRFQLNLPTTWNEKAVMVGGGGFNGTIVDAVAALRDAAPGQAQPITQGFATFGTDSGHDGTTYGATDPAKFALNDEMFLNFAHQSYKKVKDVAHVLMQQYYLRSPRKQYFYGGSEGGREGLTMAQRYPQDFDGIVSVVPVISWTGLFNGFISYQLPQFSGGAINANKVRVLANYVNTTCDALDNSADGVVSNYLACPSRINLQNLRCPGGSDTGDTCLSDAQLAVLKASYGPTVLPFPLANGLTTYPGRLYGGEIQLGGEGAGRWVTSGLAPNLPPTAADARGVIYGSSYARYVIAKNAAIDIRTWNASNFQARIQEVSALMDSTDPDLAAFRARGGKLIIRENSGDWAQSPMAGIQYYQSVVDKLTQPVVDEFVRLYVSPASNHGGTAASLTTGTEIPTNHDLLTTLDNWVTSGRAPTDALVQVRNSSAAPFSTLATRPMCRYPNYPAYVLGDLTKAESYRCVASLP